GCSLWARKLFPHRRIMAEQQQFQSAKSLQSDSALTKESDTNNQSTGRRQCEVAHCDQPFPKRDSRLKTIAGTPTNRAGTTNIAVLDLPKNLATQGVPRCDSRGLRRRRSTISPVRT